MLKREVAIGTGIPWTSLLAVLVIVREYASPSLLCHRVEEEEEVRTHTHTEKRAAQNILHAVSNEGPKFVRARLLGISLQHRMAKFEHEAQALRAS